MHSDYDVMIIHRDRMRELRREADEHRLALLVKEPKPTLWDHLRQFVASVNQKLYLGPAYSNVNCALVPAEC